MKRLLCLALACFLGLGCFTAGAKTVPFGQVLEARVHEGELSLTVQVGQAGEFTCLIYEVKEQANQGELLQVAQWQIQTPGVHTKTVLVTPCAGYTVHFGGSDIGIPKKITLNGEYKSSAWRIEGEETTQTVAQKATHLTKIEITRNENTVTPGDVVLPGDQISGTWHNAAYVGYAVVAGDVDLNGAVNAKDALRVLRYSVGKIKLSPAEFAAADFVQSQKVDAVTALNILKFSVGKMQSL